MIGLFIMDVSGSTSHNNSREISHYLRNLETHIKQWTVSLDQSYVNFRMGDELFYVSSSPRSMLILSYYIKLLWPFKNQPIKFGMAIGNEVIPNSDLEHWNVPLIKQARIALDDIKLNELVDFKLIQPENTKLYNDVLYYYLTDILNQQTALQKEIVIQNLIAPTQKALAAKMNRSVSTISAHLKKGRAKQLALIEAVLANDENNTSNDSYAEISTIRNEILKSIEQETIQWR